MQPRWKHAVGRWLPLATALAAGACSSVPLLGEHVAGDCERVELELDGVGATRDEALRDARDTAITSELGAFVTSEMVLQDSDLVVNRRGQATRGLVDSVVGIGPATAEHGGVRQRARVTLCRNNIRPGGGRAPVPGAAEGGLRERVQAMLDASDSRSSARASRSADIERAASALFNPVTGGDLHRSRVISADPSVYEPEIGRVRYDIVARVSIDPETRRGIELLLDAIAVERHGAGPFGIGHERRMRRPGLAIIDQRLEDATNPRLARSDRRHLPWSAGGTDLSERVANVSIVRGLVEIAPEHRTILRREIATAIEAFGARGLSLIGWSAQDEPALALPLFAHGRHTGATLERIALYPETAEGRWNRSNGAAFERLSDEERAWLAREVTPLVLLREDAGGNAVPAIRRGESRLEMTVLVDRTIGSRVKRFTLEPTRSASFVAVSRGRR